MAMRTCTVLIRFGTPLSLEQDAIWCLLSTYHASENFGKKTEGCFSSKARFAAVIDFGYRLSSFSKGNPHCPSCTQGLSSAACRVLLRRTRLRRFITRKPAVCWRPAADKSQHPIAPNGRPLVGAVAYACVWTDHNHRGAARVRRKRACCASFQEIASAVTRPRVCHAKAGCAGGRTWHIAPRPCSEWKRPPAGALPFSIAWTDHILCSSARARRKRACCASS